MNKQSRETTIRLATDDDLETIKGIAIAAWEPIYKHFQEAAGDELFNVIHPDWRREKVDQIVRHYKGNPETVLVTECEGRVVGFITYALFEKSKAGVICNNAIHPEYQGRGFGTKQYQKVLEIFKESGMSYAQVLTGNDEPHAPARTAYEKVGFQSVFYSVLYYKKL
jgi:ribosomal protein S18 acetylase RimI-like enzyme